MKYLRNQEGMAIFVVLIFLAVGTIIGAMSIRTSITETRISTNYAIQIMNFYTAESGIALGQLDAKTTQLADDWEVKDNWSIEGGGVLDNKCSYYYWVEGSTPVAGIPLPDITVYSEGTHPRGGIVAIEAKFTYDPAFEIPDVPLWVGGDLKSKTQSNVDNGGYAEDGITYDIMVVGHHIDYKGTGKIAPTPKEIWLDPRLLHLSHETFDTAIRLYGSADDMKLVIAEPDDDGNVFIGNHEGYGLLYVKGNLTINGNFNWHGLVYIEGDLTTYNGGGSNACLDRSDSVWGSMIVRGNANMQNGDICYDKNDLTSLFNTISHYRMTYWNQL